MLKEKRAEHQLTQEALSEKIFVSKKTISNWETGKTTPDLDSLIRLANLFDFSLDNLLLEGSDIVENIKKHSEIQQTKRYQRATLIINGLLFLVLLTQKILGFVSTSAVIAASLGIICNTMIMIYFSLELSKSENHKRKGVFTLFIIFLTLAVFGIVILLSMPMYIKKFG